MAPAPRESSIETGNISGFSKGPARPPSDGREPRLPSQVGRGDCGLANAESSNALFHEGDWFRVFGAPHPS